MALASFTVTTGIVSNDTLKISSTTDSTSTADGVLVVAGGAGIAKKLYVGSGINTTTGTFSSTVSTSQLTSTATQGTAPFVVSSTTAVTNLKADWVVTNANMTGPITGTGNVTSITSQTGTGTKFVMDTSPTLITPILGVASATSINGLTISSSTGTLTVANGKTLTSSNTLTLAGTDGKTLTLSNSVTLSGTDNSTIAFGAGGSVAYTDKHKLSAFLSTSSSELASVISDETGSGKLVFDTSPAFTTSITTGSTSFDLINTTATSVNFAKAATALSIGASTGTTTVNNDLSVTGNLTVTGTSTTVNSTTVTVNDPLLYIGANNVGDLLDLGWVGRYNNGVVNDAHVGFIRSASDKEWKLFSNVTAEPTTTVDLTSATYDNLRIGKLTTTGVNKITITSPTTGATLTLADNSSLITSGGFSTTITSTATTSVTLPTSGTLVNSAVTTLSALASVGTITSGTWSGTFGNVSGANLTSLTAGNLIGTVPSTVLANSTVYIGTTGIALNRASASQTLSGISIDGNAGTVNNGVYTTGSYADPTWISSLAYSKLTGTPSAYSLPISTASVLGGVKIGSGVNVDAAGVISVTPYTLPISTASVLGGVKIGSGVNVDAAGVISVTPYSLPTATTSVLGGVKVDGTSITIASGVISSAAYTLPTASTTVLGGVKVDGTTITINGSGVISGANTYTLPTASTTILGGVKVDGTTITINGSGVISGANTYTLPATTTTTLGGVIVPAVGTSGLTNTTGTIGLATASTTQLGGVKIDGTTITISSGVISAAAYSLPTASTSTLGGVKVDGTSITISGGTISATTPTTVANISGGLANQIHYQTAANTTGFITAASTGYLYYNGTAFSWATPAVGGGGTVTSVGGTGTVSGLTLTGTVTSSGNLTLGGTLAVTASNFASQTANYVLIAPNGAAGTPTFRALVAADIPALSYASTSVATTSASGLMSSVDKTKLDGVATGATANTGTVTSVAALTLGTTGTDVSSTVATGTTTPVITLNIPTASASNRGALSSTDWTTFNNKQAALSNASSTVSGILTSTDWNTFNGKQAALSNASSTVSGILTSTDWNTFNSKQAALVSGTSIKTVGGTSLLGSGDISLTSATKTISNQTANYTVVASDLGKIINCTANTFTVALTAAATLGSGFTCMIWNTSNTTTDAITIDPNGTETIDGLATLVLGRGEGLSIVCDGTNWQTDDKKPMRGYAENYANSTVRPTATGQASFSLGTWTTCPGAYAAAIGSYSTASGSSSLSCGYSTTASSNYSTAVGVNSAGTGSQAVTGAGAMALGGSYASGADSFAAAIANNTSTYGATVANGIAIGYQCKTNSGGFGGSGVVIGNSSITYDYSVSIGNQTQATAYQSLAIGGTAIASSMNSVAIGWNCTASASSAVAIGSNVIVQQRGKIGFGVAGTFAAAGDNQAGKMIIRTNTSGSAGFVLNSDGYNGVASNSTQLTVNTGQAMTFQGMIIAKQSGSANIASYTFKGAIVNNGGTITLSTISIETIVDTIGLDAQPTFTADNTNKGLAVTSGYKAATSIRWVCNIDSVEVTYA